LVRSLTFFIETTSPRFIGTIHIINSRLANTALIVTLPVFSPGFKQIKAVPIARLTILLSFHLIIWLHQTVAGKIEGRRCSFNYMLGVVVFGLSILDMIFLVDCMIMVEVIKSIDLVGIPLG